MHEFFFSNLVPNIIILMMYVFFFRKYFCLYCILIICFDLFDVLYICSNECALNPPLYN